jgi:hypothetical protein
VDILLTLNECLTYIPALADAPSATVQVYIDAASRSVEKYCNRIFLSDTVSERYVINQSQRIYLRRTPVTDISRVAIYQQADPVKADSCGYVNSYDSIDTNLTETKLDIDLEYNLEPNTGVLTFLNTYVLGLQYFYKVEYTGGYESCPEPVKLAIAQIASGMYSSARYDDSLQSEKIGDYSYSRSNFNSSLSHKHPASLLLAPYTRYSVNGI